jgi:hypothetical protein
MSLINDALKQARRSQQNNPPSGQPPLPPVESVSRGGMNWFLLVAIVLLLAVAGFFTGLSLTKHTPPPPPPTTAPATMQATTPELSPIQQVEFVSNSPPVSTNTPSGSNAIAAVPPPPPEPKLQGILFDPTRPCAIVDGATVFVGDRVGEFRVTAISKDKVTLRSGTETKVLNLD